MVASYYQDTSCRASFFFFDVFERVKDAKFTSRAISRLSHAIVAKMLADEIMSTRECLGLIIRT